MSLAKHMVRMMALAGMVVGGAAQVSAAGDGEMLREHGERVRTDNRGPGSMNSGPGREDTHGRRGGDDVRVTPAGEMRQEDRRADGRENRPFDRREDRQLERRDDRRTNGGGELRGLDRANHVADEHGQSGRDDARAVQMNRGSRTERVERPDHSPHPERAERSGRH